MRFDISLCNVLYEKYRVPVVVTAGSSGAYYVDKNGQHGHQPAMPVEAKDTVGAGDAFHGGLLYALTEGKSLSDSVLLGTACAAINCTVFGAREGMPNMEQVEKEFKLYGKLQYDLQELCIRFPGCKPNGCLRFGMGIAATVGKELSGITKNKILIVTDSTIINLNLHRSIIHSLQENGLEYDIFDDVQPEPHIETLEKLEDSLFTVDYGAIIGLLTVEGAKTLLYAMYEKTLKFNLN